MTAFHHPTSGSGSRFPFEGLGVFTPRVDMRRQAKSCQDVADLLIIIALAQTESLRMHGGGLGAFSHQRRDRLTHHFHIVPMRPIDRQPYGDAMSVGQHAAFDAAFASVGGVGAGRVTAQGRFGDGAIHTQPVPIQAFELIELGDPGLPQLQKHPGVAPRLIAIMGGRMGSQHGVVPCLPLTARAQHIKNRVRALAVGHTGASTAEAVRVAMDRQ